MFEGLDFLEEAELKLSPNKTKHDKQQDRGKI